MAKVIPGGKIPILLWLDDLEDEALQQARNLAQLPFAFHHIAIMPDCHTGFGMPIGGVLAARDAVVPNAVGVDIGCGMLATKSNLPEITHEQLTNVTQLIRNKIPLGFDWHRQAQPAGLMPGLTDPGRMAVVNDCYQDARKQLGTLGGGNHFIEIQKDPDGYIWIMIHSGSRNVGKQVADHYNKLAKKWCQDYQTGIPPKWDLAHLPMDSHVAGSYWLEMNFCVEFALANRLRILEQVVSFFDEIIPGIFFGTPVNIAHNYASREKHFGREVIVHRKGATRAKAGETGIIPGSQGTTSFIVTGRGNPDSFHSCSHGAGRRIGRNQARKQLDLKFEAGRLDELGILHSLHTDKDLDEAPGAYKDINQVMEWQKDLVDIALALKPIAVIKG